MPLPPELTDDDVDTHVRETVSAVVGNWDMMQAKYGARRDAVTLALAFALSVGRVAGLMGMRRDTVLCWVEAGFDQASAEGTD